MNYDRHHDSGPRISGDDYRSLAVARSRAQRGALADAITVANARRVLGTHPDSDARSAVLRNVTRVAVLRDLGLANLNDYRSRSLGVDSGTGGRRVRRARLLRVLARRSAGRTTSPASVML